MMETGPDRRLRQTPCAMEATPITALIASMGPAPDDTVGLRRVMNRLPTRRI